MNIIKKLPIPISGVMLACLSLGNLLQDIHPVLKIIFGLIGTTILILLLLKIILYPQLIKQDLKNIVILSSSGTFSMSLMILSTYVIGFMPSIAYTLWIIGVTLHIILVIYFTYHYIINNFNISNVYPSYWIVYVGLTMGSITAGFHGLGEIDFIFFIIGFIGMLFSTPIVLYREFVYRQIPDSNKPLSCIFTALFSILIVGYVSSCPHISKEFLISMYTLACIFYVYAFFKLISMRNLEFYPSFAAFTFPFVISTLATKSVMTTLKINVLSNVLTFETIMAIVLVLYVIYRYTGYLKNS